MTALYLVGMSDVLQNLHGNEGILIFSILMLESLILKVFAVFLKKSEIKREERILKEPRSDY